MLATHVKNVVEKEFPPIEIENNAFLPLSLVLLINELLVKDAKKRLVDNRTIKTLLKWADSEEFEGTTDPGLSEKIRKLLNKQEIPKIEEKKKKTTGKPAYGIILGIAISAVVIIAMVLLIRFVRNRSNSTDVTKIPTKDSVNNTSFIDTSPKIFTVPPIIKDDSIKEKLLGISLPYSDDFSTDDGKWLNRSDKDKHMGVVKDNFGQYIINGFNDTLTYFSVNTFNVDTNKDFEVSVYVKWLSGDKRAFGLEFCSNARADDHLSFRILNDGSFLIYDNNSKGTIKDNSIDWSTSATFSKTPSANWKSSNAINKNSNWNQLTVKKAGNTVSFFINNKFVYSSDNITFYGKDFGFQSCDQQKVAFDDFKLTQN